MKPPSPGIVFSAWVACTAALGRPPACSHDGARRGPPGRGKPVWTPGPCWFYRGYIQAWRYLGGRGGQPKMVRCAPTVLDFGGAT